MHYCAEPTTSTTGRVIAVTDDAQTCESLGAAALEIPAVMLPKLTAGEGSALAFAIVAVWALAVPVRAAIGIINKH